MESVVNTFMQRACADYVARVTRTMSKAVISNTTKRTGSLKDSINGTSTAKGAKLKFAEHGRFLDMGVSRGHPLGGQKALRHAVTQRGAKNIKRRKIYSSIAYGNLNGLINDLAYGFTAEAQQLIIIELQNKK